MGVISDMIVSATEKTLDYVDKKTSEEKTKSVVNDCLAKNVSEELTGEITKGFIALTSSTAYKISSNSGYTTGEYTIDSNVVDVTIFNATYSNSSAPSYLFVDSDNTILLKGTESISDAGETITVPSGAAKLIVTRKSSSQPSVTCTIRKDKFTNEAYVDDKISDVNNSFEVANETIINRIVKAEVRHNFKYTFDKPYVTFCFDDALKDLDLVASIFAEFEVPLCMALIPGNINGTCNGLTADSNGFTTGMSIKDVALKAVENGGEVLSHGYTLITKDNINDASILQEVFVTNKQRLENNGFTVRGIIQNGGSNILKGGSKAEGGYVFQYYAGQNFDYSDAYGMTEDYYHPRLNMNVSLDKCKEYINTAISNNKWISFFAHSITGIYSETNVTEENLRALLQYCKDNSVDVVTYSYIYDNYAQ